MVVALTALFVALSGASYAAVKANSIGAKQIKPNAVATSELKNGAVGTADLANGAITGEDIADESVRSGDVSGLGSGDVTDESLGSADVGGLGSADVGELGSDDITDESLGSTDVGGLGSGDVTDGSLGSGDVAPGTFLGGSVTTRFFQHPSDLPEGQSATLTVGCPAGQTGIGGGIRGDANDSEATTVTGTRPAVNATDNTNPPADGGSFAAWRGTVVHNDGSVTTGIRPEIWVICAA
jgi:hypothetical protein